MTRNGQVPKRSVLVFVLAGVVAPSVAVAGDRAEDLITQGVEHRQKGEHQAALESFRRAHALAPSPRTLAQMGLVEHDLRRWLDAETHLSQAVDAAEFPWIRKNRKYLVEALAMSQKHIGEIAVSGPTGAVVEIAGRVVGILPLPASTRVVEGETAVRVTKTGFLDFTTKAVLAGAAKVTIAADLVPDRRDLPVGPKIATSALQGPTARSEQLQIEGGTPSTGKKVIPITLITAGLVAVAAGTALFLLDGKGNCDPAPGGVCADVYNTKWLGLAVGAAGVGAGITGGVLLWRGTNRVQVVLAPFGISATGTF
jgi:hypothetical protein